ncbi:MULTISPECIES: alkaline phosphatase [unclassified Brevundimonas]|uniref:alkaline phosphatase D family protein n=1 Tax=unclassified Brevundimonas TaxID=2622653 RepID=UPI0025BB65E7|nr:MULTISPECIES: alkaline phosphatase D family protein [unclassified Brevundimonas]
MGGLLTDRRRLLATGGGWLLASGLPVRLSAAPRLGDYPFSLGVAAGDPAPDGFVIWTRLAPRPLDEHGGMPMRPVAVRWEVAEDERFTRVARVGEAVAGPELAHSVHVEVEGLKPRRPYWYRFRLEGGDASPVGMARTTPAAGDNPDRVRLAVAGCQHYQGGWFDAWRHLSQEPDLDAVFHYGDYIYEGGPVANPPVILDARGRPADRRHFGGELYSLDDYRRRYAQYKADPDLQAAHAAAAFIVSFDDHEVDNNWAGDFDQDGTPPEAFALRRRSAMQAWYEHMPVRRAQMPGAHGLTMHRRLDYGRLMRMHVLDTRSYRSDQPCEQPDDRHCRPAGTPDVTMLGAAQEAWLADGLRGGAAWNLIAQQVFVMPVRRLMPDGQVRMGAGDTWGGYPEARARLVKTITGLNLTNVVVASGDAHIHAVGTVPLRDDEPDGPAAAVEFLATSIASGGDGSVATEGTKAMLAGSPHMKLVNAQRGYQTFDVTPGEWRTDLKVLDRIQRPGGALSKLATFTVEPDRPMLE